jgi:tetratricopeptide (TPR) repeat protein
MKYFLLLLLWLPVYAQAQAPVASGDSIFTALQAIRKTLEEKNYTRIPNEDFDKTLEVKLNEKVNNEVSERIDNIRNIVLIILGIVGGALLLGLRTLVKNNVEEQLKDKIEVVNKGMKERMEEYDESMKERIKAFYLEFMKDDMRKELSIQKEELKKEIDPVKTKAQSIELELDTAKRLLLEYKISKMKTDKSANENYSLEDFEEAKNYLEQAEELKDKKLAALALTELSIAAYYTKKEREIEATISKYMDAGDMDIRENVFINLASSVFYEYATTKDKNLRTKGLKYINASLRKIKDYGEALGLKLEFLMIDFESAFEQTEKEHIKHEALVTLEQILDLDESAKEATARFKRVQTSPTEKKYIDMLNTLFPDQMKELAAKAVVNS